MLLDYVCNQGIRKSTRNSNEVQARYLASNVIEIEWMTPTNSSDNLVVRNPVKASVEVEDSVAQIRIRPSNGGSCDEEWLEHSDECVLTQSKVRFKSCYVPWTNMFITWELCWIHPTVEFNVVLRTILRIVRNYPGHGYQTAAMCALPRVCQQTRLLLLLLYYLNHHKILQGFYSCRLFFTKHSASRSKIWSSLYTLFPWAT